MKKFLSLLCAIAIVFSASAAPQFATKSNIEKQNVELVKKAPVSKGLVGKQAAVKRAPKAVQETTEVIATSFSSNYMSSYGFIYCQFTDSETEAYYGFAILPTGDAKEIESGRTYTIADMEAYYCYWGYGQAWEADFEEATLLKTDAEDGSYTVEATATDTEGKSFHITYTKAAPVVHDEPIDLNFTEIKAWTDNVASSGWWQITAQNEDYFITLSNNYTTQVAGTYTVDDLDAGYSYLILLEDNSKIKFTEGSITLTVADNGNITFVGSFKGDDGNTYNINIVYVKPQPKDPVDVKIVSFTTQRYTTDIEYHLSNAGGDSLFVFDIKYASGSTDIELNKTYTLDDMYGNGQYTYARFNNGSKVRFETAEFTKTQDAEGMIRIEATASDQEGNVWNLVYQEEPIVPSGEEVDLFFSVPMEIPQYYTDGQWELYINIESEEQDTLVVFVYNSTKASSPAGTFTEADLIANNSGIMFGNTYIAFAQADFTVTDTDERIDLVADVLGNNAVTYHIKMFYIKPQATAQESITSNELTVNTTYYSYYGIVRFSAADENNSIALTVNVNGLGAQMAGTYVAGTDFNGEVTPAGGEKSEIFSGSIVVAVAENGSITVTGTVLCSNSVEYTLNLTWVKPEPVVTNLTMDGMSSEFSASSNSIQYKLSNDNYVFFFEIYLADGLTDVELGKNYTFADDMKSDEYGSFGYDADGFIDYADATFTKTFVSGADHVEVAIKDVDGNFWNLTYQGQATAVDNVEAAQKAAKRIENGMLIIRANGKDYNAQGAVIR